VEHTEERKVIVEKLNVKALAVAGGVLWSLYMLLIGWAAWLFDWGTDFVTTMASVYIGFKPSFVGGIIGAIWAFIDGAIGGAIIAAVYNRVTRK
jgi:hypothetical protein